MGFCLDGCDSEEMEVTESCLNENSGANQSSDEVLPRWRKFCGVVKNPNLSKRSEAGAMRQGNQEKLRTAVMVSKAAFQFAIVTFAVLVQGLTKKLRAGTLLTWSGEEALEMLEHFAVAVNIIVVAVPEGLTIIAVTGEGTNDTPQLHEADNGLALGIAGTEVAKEGADLIILDDTLFPIFTVAKWGPSVYDDIKKFVRFKLIVNVVALIVNFSLACLTGNAPLTAVQLWWVNMVMDTLGALALATEPTMGELMKGAPVQKKGNFINKLMWRNILGQSLYQFAVNVIWYLYGSDADLILNTLIFSSFVFCQVAKRRADAITLDDTFSSIVTGVKWGRSVYINIQKFAQFQLKNVLPLIVHFSSACLTGNAPLTTVLLLILGALVKKTMSKQTFLFLILLGLVFLLEIQIVEGRSLKAVSDVKASPPPPSFKGMFSEEKKVDPSAHPPPTAAHLIHN